MHTAIHTYDYSKWVNEILIERLLVSVCSICYMSFQLEEKETDKPVPIYVSDQPCTPSNCHNMVHILDLRRV